MSDRSAIESRTWNPIPAATRWSVSSDGRIKGPSGDELSQQVSESGHRFVQVRPRGRAGRPIKIWVHRAVLAAFVGPCPPGMEARHLDGDPANNVIDNLAWGTRIEQRADDRRNGVIRRRASALPTEAVQQVRSMHENGASLRKIGEAVGVSHTTVWKIVIGQWYRDVE